MAKAPFNFSKLITGAVIAAVVFLSTGNASAQNISPRDLERLQVMEDSLLITADSMFEAFIPDTRVGYSERFIRQLVKTLKTPNSYFYPFNKLKEKINIVIPADGAFRIFNWGITWHELGSRYYGAVQLPSEKLKLYGLSDYSDNLTKGAEDSVLTGGKWFGALYYNIYTTEVDGQKIYTLFGLSAASPLSNKKLLDPMIVTDTSIAFGAPIFGIGSKNKTQQPIKRFILEYKKEVHVSLNWDKERGMIVFDDLASQVNDPARKYTYVPTGQYNGLTWGANNMWNFVYNLLPITELQDGQAPTEEIEPVDKGKKKRK